MHDHEPKHLFVLYLGNLKFKIVNISSSWLSLNIFYSFRLTLPAIQQKLVWDIAWLFPSVNWEFNTSLKSTGQRLKALAMALNVATL